MADNGENILVDFDYNNIALLDPNKIIDENGKVKERLVKHEELVMYVNLECKVIPRTKLLLGASNADNLRTISVSSMNFLNPGEKTFLDNAYTDELTGKDTLKGEGVNQQKLTKVTVPNKTNQYYLSQTTKSNGDFKATDNGLLGMKSISIRQGLDFTPVVTIQLEDVKGRALFESGNDSPYSAFFNLPYPLFYLTIKGYYGKALRLPLMLQDFNSTYNPSTGNFEIELTLYSYKYTVLAEVSMGALLATPHMYKSTVETPKKIIGGSPNTLNSLGSLPPTISNAVSQLTGGLTKAQVDTTSVSYGYQKVKEMYSEYKSKGLLPESFPELTLVQMLKNLDNFIKNILEKYTQKNLDPLTNIGKYEKDLTEYRQDVYFYSDSWYNKYVDTKNFFILDDKSTVYVFRKEIGTGQSKENKLSELKEYIKEYNEKLDSNETVGKSGKYKIDGVETPCSIENKINLQIFTEFYEELPTINYEETYKKQKNVNEVSESELTGFTADCLKIVSQQGADFENIDGELKTKYIFLKFEGKKSFLDYTDKMLKDLKAKREEIETKLTNSISKLIRSDKSGLSFIPTIRNVLAVIFANGEAYLRLLDDVHTKAWNQRDSTVRKSPIFNEATKAANPDFRKEKSKAFVYPWPDFIIQTTGENKEEKFQPKYPGDPDVINETKAFLYEYWPEVEFVEEFTKALTFKLEPPQITPVSNEVKDSKRLSLNAIEYPTTNVIFNNKEEVKYFFEIYERMMIYSFYSKMSRTTNDTLDLAKISRVTSNAENTNVIESLTGGNPFLQDKLKNYGFNSSNYLKSLREFSNQGVGESWQNFIRGVFNTKYLKNLTENSFKISNISEPIDVLGQTIQSTDVNSTVSLEDEEDIRSYMTGSTKSKKYDFTDTYPFIDRGWCKKYMSGDSDLTINQFGVPTILPTSIQYFETNKNLHYNSTYKVISNFNSSNIDTFSSSEPKPFSSYNFKSIKMPASNAQSSTKPELNLADLTEFYKNRSNKYNKQLPTEGELKYLVKPGLLPLNQTVSILNTPFFTNSIQEGVTKFRAFDEYPYVVPAYLFINSLPIATLKERYTKYSKTTSPNSNDTIENVEYMDYIFATLKKYGAIHKLPLAWVLKVGSVWYRYKKWAQTGVDILENSWNKFNYLSNFDPPSSSLTTTYSLTINGNQNVDITLDKDTNIGSQTYTQINTGFYPKTLDDFNVFYQGFKLFTGYTSPDIQVGITSGLTLVNVPESNITMGFSGDPSNSNRFIQINPWSAYVVSPNKKDCYLLPSHGTIINQVKDECFSQGTKKIEVSGNDSIYDGSVRNFWTAPNYGYFDASQIVKPRPDEYMKQIFGGVKLQQNFSLNSSQTNYSKISEIFSVFEKDILDQFEEKFLEFCRPKYNYVKVNVSATDVQKTYGNFQLLFSKLMKVEPPSTGQSTTQIINDLQQKQALNFAKTLNGFMEHNVLIKYGNPSNFDKRLFYTFSNKSIQDPFLFEKYSVFTPNALPSATNTQTLVSSRITYSGAWNTLIEYIGFSEIPEIEYTDTGSTIFSFFTDFDIAFTSENIKTCSPIIKIYATQKFLNKNLNDTEFNKLMGSYIDDCTEFINKSLDKLFVKTRSSLNDITIIKDRTILPATSGNQTKLDLWGTFKATNDKWISGNDFKVKTLFEDVLLLDRASRDLGDKVIVDIYKLRSLFYGPDGQININKDANMMTYVNSVLAENNFQVMHIPGYINFYGVQEVSKNPIPKPEGSLELANTLFGTFLNVDYRQSSTKMVCFYAGKPSVHLDTQGIIEGFKNDSFDIRKASDNPLNENQRDKKDWATSNKVVGFNVDVGPQNQGVFTSFKVSQKNSTPTAESLQILSEMANQAGGRGVSTQSLSLYNLYKLRSYDCDVTMMGNALIQPMMYFNLRYVPMFSGPYMITDVSHSITQGVFSTTFKGVRQPMANLPTEIDFLQTLRTNLVQQVINKKLVEQQRATQESNNKLSNTSKIVSDSSGSPTINNTLECSANTKYNEVGYSKLEGTPQKNTVPFQKAKNIIINKSNGLGIVANAFDRLKYTIFAKMFIECGDSTSLNFIGTENNFIGTDISSYWYTSSDFFSPSKKYFCVTKPNQVMSYVQYESIDKNIEFLLSRWTSAKVLSEIPNNTKEEIAKFIVLNSGVSKLSSSNWFNLSQSDKDKIIDKVGKAISYYNETN